MKKSLRTIMISILTIMFVFVSCNPAVDNADKVGRVILMTDGAATKSLTVADPSFDASTLYWKYATQKVDTLEFKTGETDTYDEAGAKKVTKDVAGLSGKVGPFSQGTWNFKLFAYTDSAYKNLAWSGETLNQKIVAGDANRVAVKVSAQQTEGKTGSLAIGDIVLKDGTTAHNAVDKANLTQIIRYWKDGTTTEEDVKTNTSTSPFNSLISGIPSGGYWVEVKYVDTANPSTVRGSEKKFVNIFDNVTTTIGGFLAEDTGSADLDAQGEVKKAVSPEVVVDTNQPTKLEVAATPESGKTEQKTAVVVPAGVLKTEGGKAKVDVTTYTAPKANEMFTVTDDSGATALAGIDLTLTQTTGGVVNDFGNTPVTVTTYIAKGLDPAKLDVKYSGNGEQPIFSKIDLSNPDNVNAETGYNPTTGELRFQTSHFSQFFVTSTAIEAINITQNKVYSKFEDAFASGAFKKGDTIVLLKDINVPGSTYIPVTKAINFDGGNHRITVDDAGSGWPGYGLFKSFTGKICNLDYETMGFKALVVNESTYGGLTFENVDVYGEMDGGDSNTTAYLIYIDGPYEFKFINCNNHANIIDNVGGAHWGAAFCGLPNGDNRYSISFENCNNYGHISIGQHAAFLIANPTNLKGVSITYTNCKNYGCIEAPTSVGVISWPNSTFTETGNPDEVNAGEGVIQVIAPGTISAFSVAVDGTPTVTCSSGNANLKYSIHFNVNYYFKGTKQSGGNRNVTLGLDQLTGVQEGKLPLKLALATPEHADKTVDATGTLYIDPYAYDMGSDEYEYRQFPVTMDYRVADYDPTSGKLLGTAKCYIDEAK